MPLYIGVELVLGIAILNKAGGVYGILSVFTGHPINFWQWFYNFLAILILPVYIPALIHLKSRPQNVRKMAFATLVYVLDTAIGVLYTLYFVYFWFSREDVDKRDVAPAAATPATPDLSAQSASQVRELWVTFSMTVVITAVRFYFTLVMVSFSRALLRNAADERRYHDTGARDDDELLEIASLSGVRGRYRRWIYDQEVLSRDYLAKAFGLD